MKQIKNTFKLKSHAKINLTFEVLGKKTKDLHEIIGVFQTIDLYDEILFKSSSSIKVECKNINIPQKSNLVFHTILKLKQGVGRLIRHQNDMGVCIIADPRILNKKYGNVVIESLPTSTISFKYSSSIVDITEKFLG